MFSKSGTRDLVVVAVETSAHGIEQGVGKMTRVISLVGSRLHTIILLNYLAKIICCLLQCLGEYSNSVWTLSESHTLSDSYCILLHIGYEVPLEAVRR